MEKVEDLAELIEHYMGDLEVEIYVEDEVVSIALDLPSSDNYNYIVNEVEKVFRKSKENIEDWDIDGDYESIVEISYIGD